MTTDLVVPSVNDAGLIKRHRPTKVQMELRRTSLVEIARDAQPASVRHIYYRAVVAGLVPKTENGYTKVQRGLLDLRRSGEIPFDWIVDDGRRAHWPLVDQSPSSALGSLSRTYRRDPWHSHDAGVPRVEIWCESRSIAGVVESLKDKYAVPIFPIGGQSSDSFAWEAAQTHSARSDRPVIVLYAGDFDPAGLEIGSQLEGKLRTYSERDNLEFRRLAITEEQAMNLQAAGLGTNPKKSTWKDFFGERHDFPGQAIEAEALDPRIMRRLFSEAIEAIARDHYYGRDIFAENRVIEAQERDQLQDLARGWSA